MINKQKAAAMINMAVAFLYRQLLYITDIPDVSG